VKHKSINKIIIILNINENNTNTSKNLSDIFSFNISDLLLRLPWKIIFLSSDLNLPCGLGIINLDNGRNLSEKKK
jgi:hypothetical protein